jgi:hypothetical protein
MFEIVFGGTDAGAGADDLDVSFAGVDGARPKPDGGPARQLGFFGMDLGRADEGGRAMNIPAGALPLLKLVRLDWCVRSRLQMIALRFPAFPCVASLCTRKSASTSTRFGWGSPGGVTQ